MKVDKSKPNAGVEYHSFVFDPAIEVLYKKFNKTESRYNFNSEKQIVTGAFMIPDMPIYRSDATHGEYYVVFEKQTILDLNEKFMSEQKTLSFNYQHNDNSLIKDVVLIENWIVAENDNKAKSLGFDLPVGTWMGSVKINNKDFWENEIKTGKVRGFSIEGYLDMEMSKIFKTNNKNNKMAKKAFSITAKASDGTVINSEDSMFMEGTMVTTIDAEGKVIPLKDGDYSFDNGDSLTVKDGKITVYNEVDESMMTVEEVAQMKKAFGIDVLELALSKANDEIKEMRIKLKIEPAAPAATVIIDTPEPTPSGAITKLSALDKVRAFAKNNQKTTKK